MHNGSGAAAERVDAVIVGAGAAGAVFAARLARAGKSVVVLEAGPARTTADLLSSQIWSRRLRWCGPPVECAGEHPVAFGFNAGWGTGGAAAHHYGTWPRLHEADFRMRAAFGRGLDWPIEYADLRPYYDELQAEVGLSGDAVAEVWRPPGAPYPMPPLRRFVQADVLSRGFAALGKRVAPAPMAINSIEYRGRAACLYDGWCDAGCPIGALANPLVTYLRDAREAGAEIRHGITVCRLEMSSRETVDAVEYRDAAGRMHVQHGRLVVLAASVAGNPALLLGSANPHHPRGIGNDRDLVGRYLQTHALVAVAGLFAESTEPHRGVSGAQLISQESYAKDSTPGAFGSRQWLIAPSMRPNDLTGIACGRPDLYGVALQNFMQTAARHAANMNGMAEDLPARENRVELTAAAGGNDRRIRLVHRFAPETVALWTAMRDEGMEIFRRAGVRDAPWHGPLSSAHMMGGTIMGRSAGDSVTDSHGRIHAVKNLWVAGPGLFPTSGAANPTFTAQALALRSARQLIAHWSQYAA